MTRSPVFRSIRAIAAAAAFGLATAAAPPPPTAAPIGYADLADLADAAQVAVHAVIRKAIPVPAERAGTVPAGHARVYVEAQTTALLAGSAPLGESLRYLVDVPLDARGKLPKLKKRAVLLFARTVPGRPGELQLVGKDGQLDWSPALGARAQAGSRGTRRRRCSPCSDRGARRAFGARHARGRIRDAGVPRHPQRRPGVAHRGPPPGHDPGLGGLASPKSSTRRRARRRAKRSPGTGSPASSRRSCPRPPTSPAIRARARRRRPITPSSCAIWGHASATWDRPDHAIVSLCWPARPR